jgi:hypothetical protein
MSQASVSKMERRSEMYLSTLWRIIEAMGGRLEIVAIMPGGAVRIRQFNPLRKGNRKPSHRDDLLPRALPSRFL